MGAAVIYVDGMNLYHGIKAKYGRKYLWLDLYVLAAQLRQPDTIIRVRYFTTIVANEPEAARRQETYLAALTPAITAAAELAPDRPIYLACPASGSRPLVRVAGSSRLIPSPDERGAFG